MGKSRNDRYNRDGEEFVSRSEQRRVERLRRQREKEWVPDPLTDKVDNDGKDSYSQ
jgi:hypothetical protein